MLIHILFMMLTLASAGHGIAENPRTLNETLIQMERAATELPGKLQPERLQELNDLAAWVAGRDEANCIFICTHNSRRSHMGAIWAQAAAWHFGLDGVRTFSGGTEATAFNPRAVAALRGLGVRIVPVDENGGNMIYQVGLQADRPEFDVFSKVYSDPVNPSEGFAAVMTCSDADEACPLVFGADARFATPYVDPKISDGTPEEAATYRERAMQIGAEMFYVMRQAASIRMERKAR